MNARARRLASPVAAGAAVALATAALRLRDPHTANSWGLCPTRWITGFDCPLCGGLRAVNDLTHADLAAAVSSNLVLVLAVPVVIAFWIRRLVVCWRGGDAMAPLRMPSWAWAVALAALCGFTVVRNLPGSWLAA